MSGHREHRAKGKYYFKMTVGAASLTEPATVAQKQSAPDGWVLDEHTEVQAPIEETVAVMMAESAPEAVVSVTPLTDEGSLKSFKSSPKSKGSLDARSGLLSARQRVIPIAGWSGLVAGGAVLIVMGPASVATIRLAELGGVWAAITAMMLLLFSKLKS